MIQVKNTQEHLVGALEWRWIRELTEKGYLINLSRTNQIVECL